MVDKQQESGGRLVGLLFGIALAVGSIGLAWQLARRAPLPAASLLNPRDPDPARRTLTPAGRLRAGKEWTRQPRGATPRGGAARRAAGGEGGRGGGRPADRGGATPGGGGGG